MSKDEPFWDIKEHRDVIEDIEQMQDNLDELEREVRRAEWVALGGRGWLDLEKVDKLTEAVAGSMQYINEDIHALAESENADGSAENVNGGDR